MVYKAMEIANYVLGYYVIEKDDFISNLKLQKVLYFLQANHLVETAKITIFCTRIFISAN